MYEFLHDEQLRLEQEFIDADQGFRSIEERLRLRESA
jgi:hypothetical protein